MKPVIQGRPGEYELCFGTDDYCLDDATEIVFDISNKYKCTLYLTAVYEDYNEDDRTGLLIREYGNNKVVEHSGTYENLSPEEFMELCDQMLDDIEL